MTGYSEPRRRIPYRARDGIVFGVCKGLAEYMGVSVFWMRVIFVVATFMSFGVVAIVAYVLAAAVMRPKPVLPLETDADAEFYNSYVTSRGMALRRLKRTFDALDRRIQRMETIVTGRDYDWERRLRE